MIKVNSELIKLVNENPNVPIYAWVDGEVVQDECHYWLGEFAEAELRNMAFVEPYGYNEQTVLFEDDITEWEECIANDLADVVPANISDEDFNKIVENKTTEKLKEIKFKPVILVYITTI